MAAAALRGYVPGAEPRTREPAGDDPVALVVVMVLLVAAVAVVAVAVITRLRHRGAAPPRSTARPDWLRGDRGRPTWRIALIAFALILGWILLSTLLGRLGGGTAGDADTPGVTPKAADVPDAGGSAPPLPTEPDGGSDLLGYFYGATVVFLAILVVGSMIAARRRPGTVASTPIAPCRPASEPADDTESLARAAEVALAEVGDLTREPRKAIIACYAAMERQLSLLPDAAPRDFDTASEVLARAVEHQALAPDSATQLVDLFEEARFSPHVMNEGHRDAAVAVLTHVLDELRSHA